MIPIPAQPDLRVPLARALCVKLPRLDLLPSTAAGLCCWLVRTDGIIEAIDAGKSIVVAAPAGIITELFTLPDAQAAAKDIPFAIAIDLAPLLAAVRRATAELN
ncbi:MAG TPA: hypothetical protein VFW87_22100 [Pirellulales bacterium]|nr:hypothetical protein [Pirellulales bacterium]